MVSALLADGSGRILGTYDKMVLVPFGEYIPFGETFPALYSLLPVHGQVPARGEPRAAAVRKVPALGEHLLRGHLSRRRSAP